MKRSNNVQIVVFQELGFFSIENKFPLIFLNFYIFIIFLIKRHKGLFLDILSIFHYHNFFLQKHHGLHI